MRALLATLALAGAAAAPFAWIAGNAPPARSIESALPRLDVAAVNLTWPVPPMPKVETAAVDLSFAPIRETLPMPRRRPPASLLLVAEARRHLGTNPGGWASLWCAKFMCLIAPQACKHVRNPNLARSWARLPETEPKVGAIAVLTRGRNPAKGHIGVVTGFDRKGNPRIISGNHNSTVAESTYPKSRVVAYVSGG